MKQSRALTSKPQRGSFFPEEPSAWWQGVKVGDLQATAQGILSAYMFFVISNGKPLERLSQERPHPTIFCAYVFLSVVGQFALHMVFLIYLYDRALRAMPLVRSAASTKPSRFSSPHHKVPVLQSLVSLGEGEDTERSFEMRECIEHAPCMGCAEACSSLAGPCAEAGC